MQKRKSIVWFIVLILAISLSATVNAAAENSVIVNGNATDLEAFVDNGVYYIEARRAFEKFGVIAFWNQDTRTIALNSRDGFLAVHTLGSNVLEIDGEAFEFAASSLIKDGRTFMPLEMIVKIVSPDEYIRNNETVNINKYLGSNKWHIQIQRILEQLPDMPNYNPLNFLEYIRYQSANPDLPVDKVALYVNIGVHKDPYSDIQPVADPYNVFAVVDKNHRFAEDFEPELGIYDGFYWVADAGEAWLEMKSAAKSDGITLTLGGTYRSVPLQRWNYNRRLADGHSVAVVDRANARPGHSEHHTGTTADLRGLMDFTGTKAQLWLAENGHKYGFIVSFQNSNGFITNYVAESWHIRWFPQWAAEIMYNENLTIMEFDNLYLNPASHGYSIDIDSVKRAVAAFGAAIDD